MKKLAKVLSLALVLVMVLSLGGTAWATETTTYTAKHADSIDSSLTVKNTGKTEHEFQLYQIFKGDVDNTGSLFNIVWGTGVSNAGQTAYGTAEAKAKTLTDATEAKAFADDLMGKGYLTNAVATNPVKTAANADASWTGLNPGYYLVIDKAETQGTSTTPVQDGAYTAYIMQVVGEVTRNSKLDVPTVVKKVGDANDTTAKAITDPAAAGITWADSADHDIGDTIPYQITGTLPTNYAEYETYYYQFSDVMTHLTYVDGSAKVYVDNGGTKTEVKTGFTVEWASGTKTLTATASDLHTLEDSSGDPITVNKDSTIVVQYQATLDSDAAIGPTGNPNEVELIYSNNPNKGGDGDHGKTPKDKNIVFTYEVDVNKVERDTNAGTKTEEEYNTLEDKTGWVKDTATSKYYKTKALTGADFTLYKKVTSDYTGAQLGSTIKAAYTNPLIKANGLVDANYYIVVGQKTGTTADSEFTFKGVDDGTYVLVETTIPDGYNAVGSATVTITATHDADSADPHLLILTVDNTSFSSDVNTGLIKTDIENQKGNTLPSTGGIGTTLFYVFGSMLVIAAGVYFVTKKRSEVE